MDQNDIKEVWLNEHAIECPAHTGRISLKQCTFFRSLPTEKTGPTFDTGIRPRRNYDTRVRDIACDSCSAWKAKGADSEEKTTRNSRECQTKKQ
jgi:hypothetical protein